MIIKEVPAEGNLTIEVSLKERKLEFHSQCVESGVNYIYAQPIRIDGKILSDLGVTTFPSLVTKRKLAPPVSSTFVLVAGSRYIFSAYPSA